MRFRGVFAVFAVVMLLLSVAAAPAVAQSDDGIDVDIGGEGDDEDEEGDDESEGEGDGQEQEQDSGEEETEGLIGNPEDVEGTTGIGSGFGSNRDDSAGGFWDGTQEYIIEGATEQIADIIGGTLHIVVGAPVPENSGWLGVFGTPTNEPFSTLFGEIHEGIVFPLTLSFMAAAILLSGSMIPFSGLIGRYSASKWVSMGFMLILAISLSWPIVSAMHHLSNAIGTSIAPTAEQLMGSDQGLQTLGTASITAAGGLYVFGWIKVMIYALIYGMRYFLLLMVMPYLFPLALTCALAAPWRRLRSFGSMILWQHVGFLVMGWPVALLWRAAYAIGWSFGVSGIANVLMMIGALVAGVVIPVVIMYQMTRMTGVVSGAVAGAGASLSARSSYRPKTPSHIRNAGARARDIGRSASSRARSMSQAVREYTPTGIGQTARQSNTRRASSGRAQSNSGSTQASRWRNYGNRSD